MFSYYSNVQNSQVNNVQNDESYITFECCIGSFKVRKTHASFIHDFTINPHLDRTDVYLDGLTPDLVTEDEIFELTTTTSQNSLIMNDKLTNKIAKYYNLSQSTNKRLKVVVVSKKSVLSNQEIEQQDVDNYVLRFNIAINLKDHIFNVFNLDLWDSENEIRIGRILTSLLKTCPVIEAKNDFEKSLDYDLPEMSGELFNYFTTECINNMIKFKVDLIDHTYEYSNVGTRFDYKRVVPVSFIIPQSYDIRLDYRTELLSTSFKREDFEDHQVSLISSATSAIKITHDNDKEMMIALEDLEVPEKKKKMMYRFKCDLSDSKRIEMAMSGIQAKKLKDSHNDIIEKRIKDKESFNIQSPTDDIEEFIQTDYNCKYPGYVIRDFSSEAYTDWIKELKKFKLNRAQTSFNEDRVLKDFVSITSSTIIQYCKFIQALFTEINLSVRENLDEDFFVSKPIPSYNCDVYLKTVGSNKAIFFFIVAKPDFIFRRQTVGVKYKTYDDDNLIVSEWSSVKLRDIENYLSITNKMTCTIAYLRQIITDEKIISQHANYILLLLLSNKDRDEEINTLLRFVYMRSLSLTDNVTTLTSKLPTCLRSRLNVYQVNKTISLISYLFKNKPRVEMVNTDRDTEGLIDIFGNSLSFKQALNFCYYGYIVNKTKQTENNQSSKLIDKILEYDMMVSDGKKLSGVDKANLDDHYHDPKSLAVICHLAEIKIKQTFGENYQKHFYNDFLKHMKKQNILSLSTIKASAKMDLPDTIEGNYADKLKKRRPKVTETFKKISEDFGDFDHPMELVNYCILQLDKTDSFNVELFSKDQHAGIREIYVVDIKVRIIQWFIESISRCLCGLFDSETMTNPNMKDFISQKLTRNAILKLDNPVMLCRSGDASKWSQTQNVTKFYQVLKRFLPVEFHQTIKSILILWFRKKIYLPAGLIDICLNCSKPLENESINFIRNVYNKEISDERLAPNSPYLRIKTGFMQGILHFTSSFFHTVVQEGFLVFKTLLVNKMFPETKKNQEFYNIILQGSDDNSESVIISKKLYKKSPNFFRILVQLKDIMSPYLGIKVSKEKTASCVPFLMEYNSTWELAGKFVMPTIKFVFVATDIPQKQTLVGRQEFYYSLLSNCLEKGATILTCNLIRLAQAEQHYLQLGYLHNQLFDSYFSLLKVNKSPALGYFMFEPAIVTGLLGFDFMLYFHSTESSFSKYIKHEEKNIPVQILNNLGYKSIADYTVNKFHYKRYNEIMDNLKFCSVDDSKARLNSRPEILYMTINDKTLEMDLLNLKMNDFSVKESLTSRFSKSEMFSSLVYILSRPVCYFNKKKSSLIKLCTDLNNNSEQNLLLISSIKKSFTRSIQYDEILEEIRPMINSNLLINKTYIQRGSSKIKLLDGLNNDSYKLLDLCKAKWFNYKTIPISDRILDKYFKQAQREIPWLKDTEVETREYLECDSFQLYYYLLNSFKDSKYIKLLDTPGKKGNLKYLISRITDVDKKLVYNPTTIKDTSNYQKRLKSNIKFVCDFPFDVQYKTNQLKILLSDYYTTNLKNDEKNIVKLVLDLINEDEISFFNDLIKFQNDLNLAIFVKPQTFDKQSGSWHGDGLMLVKSGSLIYEIKVKDSDVVKVAVNDLTLARSKFSVILKTIRELNFKIPIAKSMSSLKLNSTGILVDLYGVELEEIPEMSFNLENLRNLEVKIEHERIKIVTKMQAKHLNEGSLIDSFPLTEMALIKDLKTSENIWVPIEKVRKGQSVITKTLMEQKEATQIITICSIKTRHFIFNNLHKPIIKLNSFAKIFWKQIQDLNKFQLKINKIANKLKVKNYLEFCEKLDLSPNCYHVFRNLLLGRFQSRDDMTIELDTADINEEADFDIDIFIRPEKMEGFVESFNKLDLNNLIPTLESMQDDMLNFIDDKQIVSFAESLSKSTKGFYLHYATNDVLESKIFETILIKIKSKIKNVEDLINDSKGIEEFDEMFKCTLVCLFNLQHKIKAFDDMEVTIIKKNDIQNIVSDPKLLNDILMIEDGLDEFEVDDSFIIELDDLILSSNDEIKSLQSTYEKQRSLPMKTRTMNRINTIEKYLKNLEQVKTYFVNEINNKKILSQKVDMPEKKTKVETSGALDLGLDLSIDLGLNFLDQNEIYNYSELFNLAGEDNMIKEFPFLLDDMIEFDVPGDGGCLFYSLMFSVLSKSEHNYLNYMYDVRDQIVNIINRFDEETLSKLKIINGEDYPESLRNEGVWGDNYCITAFGILTNSIIHVRDENKWLYTTGCKEFLKEQDLFIKFINGNHFQPLFTKEDLDIFIERRDEIFNSLSEPKY